LGERADIVSSHGASTVVRSLPITLTRNLIDGIPKGRREEQELSAIVSAIVVYEQKRWPDGKMAGGAKARIKFSVSASASARAMKAKKPAKRAQGLGDSAARRRAQWAYDSAFPSADSPTAPKTLLV